MPDNLSKKQLQILPDIRYEMTYALLIPEHDAHDIFLREAVFLAFMVHARNLLFFFEEPDKRQKDDVVCGDFGFDKRKLNIKTEDRLRFGKDMMHLTYERLRHTSATKPWPIGHIYSALKPVCLEFTGFVLKQFSNELPSIENGKWRDFHKMLLDTGDKMVICTKSKS